MDTTPSFQAAALAYASDITLSAFEPGSNAIDENSVDASLDHALWLHRLTDLTEWHLFELNCISISNSRSTVQGTLHSQSGVLAASMAQELLVRRNEGGPVQRTEGRWIEEITSE